MLTKKKKLKLETKNKTFLPLRSKLSQNDGIVRRTRSWKMKGRNLKQNWRELGILGEKGETIPKID